MSDKIYDYCIVGAGAAGLHLMMAMARDPWFDNKEILVIDKSQKSENDRTWCFWETGDGLWDNIIDHKWSNGKFISPEKELYLQLQPYNYKKLRGIDFYNHAREIISSKKNIKWVTGEVQEIIQNNGKVNIKCSTDLFHASHCFDSRIDEGFNKPDDKYFRILQHFKGWTVRFEKEVFDPESFTMMDFRFKHGESTSFAYVLPVNSKEALVEFTLFTKNLLAKEDYDPYLKKYISNYISSEPYQVKEVEYGVIPMTNYPFHISSSERITKIGTAGSWVRASSGYSFKYAEKNVSIITKNIKAGKRPDYKLIGSKYRFYDTLLLDILYTKNHLGPGIFYQMYSNNPVQRIFKFLDGESTLLEDFKIVSRLSPAPFLRALINYIFA